jgi:thymidylate synthase
MFTTVTARNVQEAYVKGLRAVREEGQLEDTRNGPAMVIPWPVLTIYEKPCERVLLDPVRDANPFFHLQEGIWMLAGRNDVESIGRFIGGLKKYSDDGVTYHGAYGHRWRVHFDEGDHWCQDQDNDTPIDQLARIVELLRANPGDRRIVLQMWDPRTDLGKEGKDFPCNTQCLFRVNRGALSMTVFNRSNDAIWGAYGANAVHFSVLQEFVAAAIGAKVGPMYQWSNNLHAYMDTLDKVGEPDMYTRRDVGPGQSGALIGLTMYDSPDFQAEPLFNMHHGNILDPDFIFEEIEGYWDETLARPPRFFTVRGLRTLELCRDSYAAYKSKEYDVAQRIAGDIPHADWRRACVEWLERRAAARAAKTGD